LETDATAPASAAQYDPNKKSAYSLKITAVVNFVRARLVASALNAFRLCSTASGFRSGCGSMLRRTIRPLMSMGFCVIALP
jgi:hypothetical protein